MKLVEDWLRATCAPLESFIVQEHPQFPDFRLITFINESKTKFVNVVYDMFGDCVLGITKCNEKTIHYRDPKNPLEIISQELGLIYAETNKKIRM
jgi:hypothetical protein